MRKHGYIAILKSSLDYRAGGISVNLSNTLRKVWVKQVWSPRFDMQLKDLEKQQNHLLPARLFGVTALMDDLRWHHDEHTRERKILGFFPRDVIRTYRVSQCGRGRGREPSPVSCLPAAAGSLPGHWTGRNESLGIHMSFETGECPLGAGWASATCGRSHCGVSQSR